MVPNDEMKECVNATSNEEEWCGGEVNRTPRVYITFQCPQVFFLLFFSLLKRGISLPLWCSTLQTRTPQSYKFRHSGLSPHFFLHSAKPIQGCPKDF